jgi:5S rRNA maturation endonuclease (ribonuclease M5)
MSNSAKKEYLQQIRKRYFSATRPEKSRILDEFCTVCNYNRKYAIRLICKKEQKQELRKGRPRKYYSEAIKAFLKDLWIVTNLACSKRLKAAIALWLPSYKLHYKNFLSDKDIQLLYQISPRTIDRLLKRLKSKYKKFGLCTTKPGSLLKKHIPIKVNQWDETKPGFIEADTVAHCGDSIAGQFVYTLNTVDIATGWTEQRAIWGRGKRGVFEAIKNIRSSLPFKILGFDCDNGGELLNYMLLEYFTGQKNPIQYTRSREYKKNDNAHIEEKNWTHVRQFIGYQRFDKIKTVDMLNDLYLSEWRLYLNFFIPSFKLLEKRRDGSKIIKKFDSPLTPYQRLLCSNYIKSSVKKELTIVFKSLDPFLLEKKMKIKIKNILKLYDQ